MRKVIIKTVIAFLITLLLLFNLRFIAIYNQRFMIANFDKRETWSEIFNIIPEVRKAEYFEPPYEIRSEELLTYEYYLVLYTKYNLYTVHATDFDLERVERLLSHEQVKDVSTHIFDTRYFHDFLW
jgi:hypothetical protein